MKTTSVLLVVLSLCLVNTLFCQLQSRLSRVLKSYQKVQGEDIGERDVIDIIENVSNFICSQKCQFNKKCVTIAFQSYPGQTTTGECFLLAFPSAAEKNRIVFKQEHIQFKESEMKFYSLKPSFIFEDCDDAFRQGHQVNGLYFLKEFGWHYCNMNVKDCGSGGWTLAMFSDGGKDFLYKSDLWTTEQLLNQYAGMNDPLTKPAKYLVFNEMNFTSICFGMKVEDKTRYTEINQGNSSLLNLFQGGETRTDLSLTEWKSLFPDPNIQEQCIQLQGFNIKALSLQLRLGIAATDDQTCKATWSDSWIGVGNMESLWCHSSKTVSTGNQYCSLARNILTSAQAYIYIK